MRIPRSSTALKPPLEDDLPLLYEDEEDEMGEANTHVWVNATLYFCLPAFLKSRHPALQVFQNMNCYYSGRPSPRTGRKPNFAADIMIVHPAQPMSFDSVSYTIGVDGPAPKVVLEVLSEETAQTRDLKEKRLLYARLGIAEYILVDLTGRFLPKKLELNRLQATGKGKFIKNADGGATSKLGFRLFIDAADPFGLAIIDAATGERVVRPHEVDDLVRAEAQARQLAEERLQALQAEMDRMRNNATRES